MARTLTTIAFDADDTLWHNERFFQLAQERFFAMLGDDAPHEALHDALLATERRNLGFYGFGVKGFTLSMLETAALVAPGRVDAAFTADVLALGREMLAHPVELLPGVDDALDALSGRFDLMVITKGDLFDQERKLEQSGLADRFGHIEIVSDKKPETYRRVFDRHGQGARRGMMVGNSLKSDIIPALEAGAWGVHVPHALTWALEHAAAPEGHERFAVLPSLADLPALVDALAD
jgi:putative hydrolase of the HAD superfamily